DGRSRGSAAGNWVFMRLIVLFGPLPAYALLCLVALGYAVFDRETRRAIRGFRAHLGLPTRFVHIYRHVYSFGVNLIDSLAFLAGKQDFYRFSSEGEDLLVDLLGKGKGLILLSAHVGNWEVAANLLPNNRDITVNVAMLDNEREQIRRVFKPATEKRQVNIIPVNGDPLDIMIRMRAALGRNETVCILGDRVRGAEDSQAVSFLGEPAAFPRGPFAVAAITGAPVVTVLTLKKGLRHFHHRAVATYDFDGVSRAGRAARVTDAMREYVRVLEQAARERPYQWYNLYDFWSQGRPAPSGK
ncbi:MAG: hypothetical protein GF410_14200, partial [Chitinivibrionales bacterium]|nr:hypothetical protein [Chitinivibrionales bacterium]